MIKLKLYSLARQQHYLHLYTQYSSDDYELAVAQWLNIGPAMYLLGNMPHLDAATLPVVISVPEDKINSYHVEVEDMPESFFVGNELLSPLKDEEKIEYHIQYSCDEPVIVAMSGMLVRAIIAPHKFKGDAIVSLLSTALTAVREKVAEQERDKNG